MAAINDAITYSQAMNVQPGKRTLFLLANFPERFKYTTDWFDDAPIIFSENYYFVFEGEQLMMARIMKVLKARSKYSTFFGVELVRDFFIST